MTTDSKIQSRGELSEERYLDKLRTLARNYYNLGNLQTESVKQTGAHLKGFVLAGTESGLVSQEKLEAELEALHLSAFGCSRDARKELNILGAEIPIDWDYYEEPTFLRYNANYGLQKQPNRNTIRAPIVRRIA